MLTVSAVLARAADLLDRGGICRAANARLPDGKACGVFSPIAQSYSMYGALCAVLGHSLGGDKSLQGSAAWKLIAIRAWEATPQDWQEWQELSKQELGKRDLALHTLNDIMWKDDRDRRRTRRGDYFRTWATDPDIIALGEWK